MYKKLERISAHLSTKFADEDSDWQDSPFEWIKYRPPRQKGKIGELLVAGLCKAEGLGVTRSPDSDADLIVEGIRVEVKLSTLWKSGQYRFQQVRDQNYRIVVCLGLSPFTAHCWAMQKDLLLHHWDAGSKGIRTQHGGSRGADTAWITLKPSSPPTWMQDQGGTVSGGMEAFRSILDER